MSPLPTENTLLFCVFKKKTIIKHSFLHMLQLTKCMISCEDASEAPFSALGLAERVHKIRKLGGKHYAFLWLTFDTEDQLKCHIAWVLIMWLKLSESTEVATVESCTWHYDKHHHIQGVGSDKALVYVAIMLCPHKTRRHKIINSLDIISVLTAAQIWMLVQSKQCWSASVGL